MTTMRADEPAWVADAAARRHPRDWARNHAAALQEVVRRQGWVRVCGLDLSDAATVADVADMLCEEVMGADPEPFAPREQRGRGVHSSSRWPSNEPMCMHHEASYSLRVPQTLILACLTPPDRGGVTGLADSAEVLRRLPQDLTDRFRRDGWLLVRSFGDVVGIPWPEAFHTTSRAEVESYCRVNGIEWTWQRDGGLTTRQRRRAVLAHPVSGQPCWFNQVAFLNEWTLAPEVRDFLCAELGRDRLPFNTLHGNGDPVTPEEVSTINDAYEELTERTPWGRGDLVIVDNLRAAHSREVYEGPRDVVVVLADPYRQDQW